MTPCAGPAAVDDGVRAKAAPRAAAIGPSLVGWCGGWSLLDGGRESGASLGLERGRESGCNVGLTGCNLELNGCNVGLNEVESAVGDDGRRDKDRCTSKSLPVLGRLAWSAGCSGRGSGGGDGGPSSSSPSSREAAAGGGWPSRTGPTVARRNVTGGPG